MRYNKEIIVANTVLRSRLLSHPDPSITISNKLVFMAMLARLYLPDDDRRNLVSQQNA